MTGNLDDSAAPVDPATVFTALAEIVYQGSDLSEVYAAICVAATLMVPGCQHASLLLRRGEGYATAAASDAVARKIDKLELAVGDGPCLDAIEEDSAQVDTDLTVHSQWPALAARVVAETPVRGAMGFRLLVDGRKVGALNLFADAPNVFDKASAERAIILAAFATVAINAAARGDEAASLQRGLASNREIGKAIGMMMVLNDISEAEAFDLLRRTSQDTNIKVADIAAEIVRRRGRV
ncbi:GAF and ANTAR domain-containing protein [Mycobacterium sp. pUA109]|uniref:GAF and ANTAR domain-containing protein n=1 Tax=Mycobacterium sp. pUA109 TaxID=3238982 RepID=UPI00351ABC26